MAGRAVRQLRLIGALLVSRAGSAYDLSMRPALLAVLAVGLGCGGSDAEPDAGGGPADAAPTDAMPIDAALAPVPLTLDLLTEPTTADEVAGMRAAWDARDTAARDVTVEATGSTALGDVPMTYLVLGHTVDGLRHVGVVLVPEGLSPASAPVLLYAHAQE